MLAGSAVPLASRRTILSSSIVQAAEQGDTAAVDALLDTEGYVSIDCRSLNQSTLLHLASKNGHCHLTQRLLARGADVNALDYGGMRRTPLHWACKGGHVRMVELLVAHGADTKADGRSWSKLVQGSRCGSLIPKDSPTESVESVCRTNAVRLALTQPRWQPEVNHSMWPARFQEAARVLLLATHGAPHGSSCDPDSIRVAAAAAAGGRGDAAAAAGGGGDAGSSSAAAVAGGGEESGSSSAAAAAAAGGMEQAGGLPLSQDTLYCVLAYAAYPISAWV